MRSIHQLLWRCLIDRLNSLHVGCGMFGLWTRLTGSRASADGSTVPYCTCSFIGSALFYDADSRLPRLSGLGFVLSHQFGIRRTGECFDVRRSPQIMTVRRRSTAPRPPRRDALWRTLDCTLIQNQLRTEETGATSRKQRTAASVYQ